MEWIRKSILITPEVEKKLKWLKKNSEIGMTESQIIRVAILELYKTSGGGEIASHTIKKETRTE